MTEFIDSHCHLNYDYAPKSVEHLIEEAKAAGIVAMVTIGTDVASIEAVEKISEAHSQIYHTVGMHPHDTVDLKDEDFHLLEKAAQHPKCRAIGEIGLDYHYDHSPREIQKKRLQDQIELALKLKQPIVIHSREGEDDLLAALKTYSARCSKDLIPGIIHCFTGTIEFGRACLDLGFLISFSGIVTFKKAEDVQNAAREFPLERMLVETDSPFLAPIPFRGKKCEPAMVKFTALKIAELKGISVEAVARQTTANARQFFRMS